MEPAAVIEVEEDAPKSTGDLEIARLSQTAVVNVTTCEYAEKIGSCLSYYLFSIDNLHIFIQQVKLCQLSVRNARRNNFIQASTDSELHQIRCTIC